MADRAMVLVIWHDAHSMSEYSWMSVSDLPDEPREIMSVGVLLPGVCKNHLVLVQSLDSANDTVDHAIAIPHGMIKSITKLDAGIRLPIEELEPKKRV